MPTNELLEMMRKWLMETYPEAKYASLVVRLGDDVPTVCLPVVQRSVA
jgi:hypothetical protein